METIERLLLFADAGRESYDIAAANIQAAAGLPGADGLDAGFILSWLDRAAEHIRLETLRHSYRFRDRPEDFGSSPAYFSMLVMATVLRQDFGVRYNPARIRDPKFQDPNCFDPDFSDSRDLFLHGIIGGPGGTCASMPVLYAAIGRRLGYPLKLAEAKGHLFVRWDDPLGQSCSPGARFNIEATSEGLSCPSDDRYRTWPIAIGDAELAHGVYLRPLTPRQDVAVFRAMRGDCLWENNRYADALREYGWAVALVPDDQRYVRLIMDSYKKYRGIMATKTPADVAQQAMPFEDEIELQKCIVRGHYALMEHGRPGYNLAEYGIYPRAILANTERRPIGLIFPQPHVGMPGVVRPGPQGRHTMTSDPGVQHGWAGPGFPHANGLNAFNRNGQARIRRGNLGLDTGDSSS